MFDICVHAQRSRFEQFFSDIAGRMFLDCIKHVEPVTFLACRTVVNCWNETCEFHKIGLTATWAKS